MNKHILSIIFLVILSAKCWATTYTHYSYNSHEFPLQNSDVAVIFTETYDEKNKVKIPSSIQFWITSHTDKRLNAFEVKNIELLDPATGNVQNNQKVIGRNPRSLENTNGRMNSVATFKPNFSSPLPKTLKLRATVVISLDQEVTREETIEMVFTLSKGKERHWDWFDKWMSV